MILVLKGKESIGGSLFFGFCHAKKQPHGLDCQTEIMLHMVDYVCISTENT